MEFTYSAYGNLIKHITLSGYNIASYHNHTEFEKACILRHDVDCSLEKALTFAKLEHELGVSSTYFVLLSSDFYNLFSGKSAQIILEMVRLGHDIGLHFDETRYAKDTDLIMKIKEEAKIMSDMLKVDVKSVSMHIPSKQTLQADYRIDGIVNSYGNTFFKGFKYISDSEKNWRENPYEVVGSFERIHLLTHAIWYDEQDISIADSVKNFVNSANADRYYFMATSKIVRDMGQVMRSEEVL